MRRLRFRGQRCEAAWRSHIFRSRTLILEAARHCRRNEKVLILGSGPLFDIPVAELSWRFRNVVLVDLLHPWKVHTLARRYPNVRLQCIDVTGVIQRAYTALLDGRSLEEVPQCKPDFFLDDEVDLVVSANILSQLPLAPVRYASRLKRRTAPWEAKAFSRRLVVNHLDWLASFSGNVCLMSDLERLYCDGDTVVCQHRSLWGVDLPLGGQTWTWDLGPKPEIDPNLDVRHRVIGYARFPKQLWLEDTESRTKA